MPSTPITIEPLTRPFDVTFPDPSRSIPPIPGSKSLTNRALLLAALAEGKSTLTGVLFSADSRVMIKALQDLGFTLDVNEATHTVTVEGRGGRIPAKEAKLHLGNAGTAMRFLTAACCLGAPGSVYELSGIPRMHERPIGELVTPLRQLGAQIEYLDNEGYPPLKINGMKRRGGDLDMPEVISSQYISALLHIGPFCGNGLALHFKKSPISWPYVIMTASLMCQGFSADIPPFGGTEGHFIAINPKPLKATHYHIEPDASNASYFLAAAAIYPGSRTKVNGIGFYSLQGDTLFASQILGQLKIGADFTGSNTDVCIRGTGEIKAIVDRLNDMPDMAQTLAVVALFAEGKTVIRNVGNLRVKETDRMEALRKELTKLGAEVQIEGDDIHITPPKDNILINAKNGRPMSDDNPVFIDTYDDHRMAMAFSIAGLRQAGLRINDPDCVNKTFPDFFRYLEYLRHT